MPLGLVSLFYLPVLVETKGVLAKLVDTDFEKVTRLDTDSASLGRFLQALLQRRASHAGRPKKQIAFLD